MASDNLVCGFSQYFLSHLLIVNSLYHNKSLHSGFHYHSFVVKIYLAFTVLVAGKGPQDDSGYNASCCHILCSGFYTEHSFYRHSSNLSACTVHLLWVQSSIIRHYWLHLVYCLMEISENKVNSKGDEPNYCS